MSDHVLGYTTCFENRTSSSSRITFSIVILDYENNRYLQIINIIDIRNVKLFSTIFISNETENVLPLRTNVYAWLYMGSPLSLLLFLIKNYEQAEIHHIEARNPCAMVHSFYSQWKRHDLLRRSFNFAPIPITIIRDADDTLKSCDDFTL